MDMLSVKLAGLKLKNPLVLASGILGSRASSLSRIAENAGAVITKSVGVEGREGYRNPTVVNLRCGILNAVGLASPPAEEFKAELKESGLFGGLTPLIVSLFGYTPEEFAHLVEVFEDVADGYEVNMSCPHVERAGLEIGNDLELASRIIREMKDRTDKTVIAKISAMHRYIDLARELEKAGIDAISITNTLRGMKIDVVLREPVLSNVSGGWSGEAIKPIAVKCVYDLYREVDVPIVGCGGVTTFEDVLEFILAGASAVAIGSAVFYSPKIFYSLKESLIAYTRATGERIADLIGAANRR